MAGDWVKMRCALQHDPKVIAVGRFIHALPSFSNWLSIGTVESMPVCNAALRYIVTGALHVTWSAANEHAKNGTIVGATLEWIDLVTGISGFGQAMQSVGWATIEDGSLQFPKFDSNNTSSAERVRKFRERQRQVSKGNSNALLKRDVTLQETPEKRRVEKRVSTNVDTKYPADFLRFWEAFPAGRKTKKPNALKAWKAAVQRTDPETIIAAAIEYAASDAGRGEFVSGPEPWLNGNRWDDDRAAWADRRQPNGPPKRKLADLFTSGGSR
jgi:hypothetical protein